MKLNKLELKNFRQFYGEQTPISFSNSPDKNVTLLFGANGAGKSTLLNAFTWSLYCQTTPALANPNHLVCERAIIEAEIGDKVETSVSLEFTHENKVFVATRSRKVEKIDNPAKVQLLQDNKLTLQIIGEDGQTEFADNPSPRLDQVLPERLHSFFFFDGERIEKIAKKPAHESVEEAIKNILGLIIIERAIDHLEGKVKSILDDELSDVGNQEIKNIIKDIQNLEKETKQLKEDESNLEKNLKSSETQLSKVKEKLRKLEATKDLQEKIDQLEERESELKSSITSLNQEIKDQISKAGYTAFINPLVNKSFDFLEDKIKKGEIPSGIKKQFVKDLLEQKTCICGSCLEKNTPERKSVKTWLNKAGLTEIEDEATKIRVQLQAMQDQRNNFYSTLKKLQTDLNSKEALLTDIQEQIDEIEYEISDRDSEEIQDLADKRGELKEQIKSIHFKIGKVKNQIEEKEKRKNELEKEKNEAEAENEIANLIKRQLKTCAEARDFFKAVYELKSHEVRHELDSRIKKIYNQISFKNYWPEITDDFRLALKKGIQKSDEEVHMDVAKSTGENQILSLSFITSVVNFARSLYEQNNDLLSNFSGGIYPIIMDSPFGSLDDNYRERVAEVLPELAEQIVIIVSKSQGKKEIIDNLKNHIGRSYVLSYFTPNTKMPEETLPFNGKKYPYINHSGSHQEWAEIKEIN